MLEQHGKPTSGRVQQRHQTKVLRLLTLSSQTSLSAANGHFVCPSGIALFATADITDPDVLRHAWLGTIVSGTMCAARTVQKFAWTAGQDFTATDVSDDLIFML